MSQGTQPGVAPDPSIDRSHAPSNPRGILRIVLALVLIVVALQIAITAWNWITPAGDAPALSDLRPLMYFTLQANLIAGLTLIVFAVALFARIAPTRWMEYLRGLATVALLLTATVNVVALGGGGDVVFHVVVPLFMTVWWVLMPPVPRLSWWAVLAWLAYPIAWLALVYLVRNARADKWVPYYFLDPASGSGWTDVVFFIGVILAVFAAWGALVVLIARLARWARAAWAIAGVPS